MLETTLQITSSQNPKVKQALALVERRERKKTGLFLIEGYRELKKACQAGVEVISLFVSEKHFLGTNEPALIEAFSQKNTTIIPVDEKIFEKLSYRDRPDGLLGIARQMKHGLDVIEKNLENVPSPMLLVAESIEKPGNLGTILRSCDAVGAQGAIVCDPCTDIYNPNVVRASVGTLFTLPVVEESGLETLKWLKEKKIKIVAATPSASMNFTEADLTGPIAIAVGTEQTGLSELWMSQADIQVKIPMRGFADSLNVATATTLLLYEALRQRHVNC